MPDHPAYRHDAPRLGYDNVPAHWECSRCGQALATPLAPPTLCESCRDADREPQGEAARLFQPAPNQLPGQLQLG